MPHQNVEHTNSLAIQYPSQFAEEFAELYHIIQQRQDAALRAVNAELIDLYWYIGEYLHKKLEMAGWGKHTIENLATYLQQTLPNARGFSAQNLWRMRQFYDAYNSETILSPLVRELSWTHHLIILSKCKTMEERTFYAVSAVKERWTKRELERQIQSAYFERTLLGNTQLPPAVQTLQQNVQNIFKDRYVFEFLQLPEPFTESDLRKGLVSNLKQFMLEFGKDFLLVGEEMRVQVGLHDYFIDLVLFHRDLQCLVAIELKIHEFQPEYLGKLAFYLEALDRNVRKPNEHPSIGILLCKTADATVVEYALNRTLSPTLVAEYELKLPNKHLLEKKIQELFDTLSFTTNA